jgi:hypothetical protein
VFESFPKLCSPRPATFHFTNNPCLAIYAGKYDLQLLCMPDSWVGCDRAVPIKLRVEPRTRADREGRGRRAGLQRSEESEALMQGGTVGGCSLEWEPVSRFGLMGTSCCP